MFIIRKTKRAENIGEKLINFSVSSVPEFLLSSAFYNSLNQDDDEEISLPQQHFKQDSTVKSVDDAMHLLCTLRFWGSSEIPTSLMTVFKLNSSISIESVREQFGDSFETVNFLCLMIQPDTNRMNLALERGLLGIAQYLLDEGEVWDKNTACKHAAMSGKVECLRYIHEKGGILNNSVCKVAIQNHSLDCLQYAIENGVALIPNFNYLAAEVGNLPALQYMYGNHLTPRSYVWDEDLCRVAAENNQLACLQYAHDNGATWSDDCTTGAAASGHLHILQYLHEQGCPWQIQATHNAAYHNHLDCLIYLHENGCPWNETTAAFAANKGNSECLTYLFENDCPLGTITINMAAEGNNFHLITYLLDNGCPLYALSDNVYKWAARYGDVAMMQYLKEHDIVMENNTRNAAIEEASRYGHLDCLKFAVQYRSPVLPAIAPPNSHVLHESMATAAENGYVDCMKYVHGVYYQPYGAAGFLLKSLWPTKICNNAAKKGHLECLKYAHEVGCPWDKVTPVLAASAGKTQCLKYLLEHGCPNDGITTLKYYANQSNSAECKEYIRVLESEEMERIQSAQNKNRFCCSRLFR